MKSPTDVVSGFILLGLCAVGAYSVSLLPAAGSTENVGPGGVPRAVLVILAVLSCILIVKGLRQMPHKRYWPEPRVFKKSSLLPRRYLSLSDHSDRSRRPFRRHGKPALRFGRSLLHQHLSLSSDCPAPARQAQARGGPAGGCVDHGRPARGLWLVFPDHAALKSRLSGIPGISFRGERHACEYL